MPAVFSKVAVALLLVAGGANAAVVPRRALSESVGASTEVSLNDLKAADDASNGKPFPTHSWTNLKPHDKADIETNAQVQTQLVQQEKEMNQQQLQKMQQLIQQQQQQQQQQADQKKQHGRLLLDDGANSPDTQSALNTLKDADSLQNSKPYPKHSWTNIKPGSKGVTEDYPQVESQVVQAEQNLNAQQKQQLQQLVQQQEAQQAQENQQAAQQQQQHGRHMLDATQTNLNELAAADKVNDAKPYPFHSWENIHGKDQVEPASQVQQQVQQAEQSMNQQQQAQMQALIAQQQAQQQAAQEQKQQDQQQHGRRLLDQTQDEINTLKDADELNGSKKYPKHSWDNIHGKGDIEPESQIAAQVQVAESKLNNQQKQQLQQMVQQQEAQQQQENQQAAQQQQQNQGRRLQQDNTQQDIQIIHDVNAIKSAQPFPFHSWEGTSNTKGDSPAQIQAQAQQAESSLNQQQQQQLAQMIASQKQ